MYVNVIYGMFPYSTPRSRGQVISLGTCKNSTHRPLAVVDLDFSKGVGGFEILLMFYHACLRTF